MDGIRVNISTGKITHLKKKEVLYIEIRTCAYCEQEFEARRYQATRFCSISCSKKGQKNRLGQKHKPETIEKIIETKKIQTEIRKDIEIVPKAKLRNRTKYPHFVNDHHQWANRVYGEYRSRNKIPHKSSHDYGLYKYGEWLFLNETYEKII